MIEPRNPFHSPADASLHPPQNIDAFSLAREILAGADPQAEIFRSAANSIIDSEYVGAIYKFMEGYFIRQENTGEPLNLIRSMPSQLANSPDLGEFLLRSRINIIQGVMQPRDDFPGELQAAVAKLNIVDAAFLPIQIGSRLAAFMVVGSEAASKITLSGMETYAEMANNIGNLLKSVEENTRLQDAAKRRVEKEQLLREITSRMRMNLDIDEILQTTAKEMATKMGLDEVEIRLVRQEDEAATTDWEQ